MENIKVLVVDDSVVYRSQIKTALAQFPWIEIVGTAPNGRIAIEKLKQTPVDLMTLDMEMPEMDGLETLAELSRLQMSVKTLVFSSVSKRGADITLKALRLGAFDFVTKPGNDGKTLVDQVGADPSETIRALLEPKLRALFPQKSGEVNDTANSPAPVLVKSGYPKILWDVFKPNLVVIGSSTGGPNALEKIFQSIEGPFHSPIVIVQHMPPIFTAGLAERISKLCGIRAKEGEEGETLISNCIYVAPGGFHMTLEGSKNKTTIKLDRGPLVHSVRPAVDLLFASAARIYHEKCLGIVLTGMGHDGRSGAQAIKEAGGAMLIQDRESSVVYGMPGSVCDVGAFDKVCTLSEIANILHEKFADGAPNLLVSRKTHAS